MDSIKDTLSIFNQSIDLQLIDSINLRFSHLDAINNQTINTLTNNIEDLNRQLENIQASYRSLQSSNQNKLTKSDLKNLQNDIFNIARDITSLIMQINTLKLSYNESLKKLNDLQISLSNLSTSTPSNNPDFIKLKLYNSTALNFSDDQIIILNKSSNNLTQLKILDSYTDYFITNFIWDNI